MANQNPDGTLIIQPADVIEAQQRAELDIAVTTAKNYPRNLETFGQRLVELAAADEEVAEDCFYALPRDGKMIEGPSVRLAELVVHSWGNAHAAARVISIGKTTLKSQGVFRDLETNTIHTFEVERRITYKSGTRYSDDMITTTGNAANKIAYRNAVFAGVPKIFWKPAYLAARRAAIGEADSITTKVDRMVKYFSQMGVRPGEILHLLGVESEDHITGEMLVTMKGIGNAIKEGDISVDEAFGRTRGQGAGAAAPPATSSEINDAIRSATGGPRSKEKNGSPEKTDPETDGELPFDPDPGKASPQKADKPADIPTDKPATPAKKASGSRRADPGAYFAILEAAQEAGISPGKLNEISKERYNQTAQMLTEKNSSDLLSHISELAADDG